MYIQQILEYCLLLTHLMSLSTTLSIIGENGFQLKSLLTTVNNNNDQLRDIFIGQLKNKPLSTLWWRYH